MVMWGVAVLGCKGYKTPEDAVAGLGSGLKECDQKKIRDAVTKASWDAIEELGMSIKAMLPEEKAKAFFPLQGWCDGARDKGFEVGNSRMKGEEMVVEGAIVDEKGKRVRFVMPVVEEGGGWRVDLIGLWKTNFGEKQDGE
jgi:hypothetical protein